MDMANRYGHSPGSIACIYGTGKGMPEIRAAVNLGVSFVVRNLRSPNVRI